MKRILQVISTLEQGGTEAVVLNYLAHMDAQKIAFDFLVIWGEKEGYHEKFLREQGCKIFRMTNPPNAFTAHGKELKAFFRRERYDVVHIHAMSALRYRVAKAAKKAGVRTVIYHSHNSLNENHLFAHNLLRGRLERWCDRKFACSEKAGRYMYKGDFDVINNAIDVKRFAYRQADHTDLRRKYGLENKFVIGNVARLTDVKNQMFLLHAAVYLKRKRDDFVIFCIGEGDMRPQLQAFADDNGLTENLILAGTVGTEVYRYYSMFDCLAFPSKFEGLSVVLLEAQAAGLPIVASDAITAENKIADAFRFLPIDRTEENYANWSEAICQTEGVVRADNATVLRDAGYDIETEAKKLQEFYLTA